MCLLLGRPSPCDKRELLSLHWFLGNTSKAGPKRKGTARTKFRPFPNLHLPAVGERYSEEGPGMGTAHREPAGPGVWKQVCGSITTAGTENRASAGLNAKVLLWNRFF